ncbi:branched-chain amino acid ABC transporter permease [Streptomyces radicis]|uniref:Branched-chain amino acid ABC transporter permease n=1 Tax=Streptomyces radicis TaxID=1750517 RepID=A0A3A9W0C3_9ACTN|nr:branched-chain amino acid ABC transporter permease [Streptomyces radicis]RKN06319.1 branched-chain amino acid ABC transporter permease [Streptomyces radicis]RKN18649.1 branched-chain amino acid ABC transporter permease [Streptomyces radicis]
MTTTAPTAKGPRARTAGPAGRVGRLGGRRSWLVTGGVALALLTLPYSALDVPLLLDGPVNSAGSLQLFALCLVFAGLALSYDVLFGRTGLLSFGHALWIAGGAYGTQLAMERLDMTLLPAAALTLAAGTAAACLLGAISLLPLALGGIGFAMVTLAFAQAGSIWVERNPGGLTGGEEGLPLDADAVPSLFVGIGNTVNVYWLALGYLALVAALVWAVTASPVGKVWQAIRDNEQRVSVLGRDPFLHKLGAFVLASALALLGGVVHLLVTSGATPETTTAEFTLTLLVMVVLGGAGTRWGPIIGGALFIWLDHRLTALGVSDAVAGLPEPLAAPLSEPLVVLGALFVVAVYAAPGGLAALGRGRRR